MRKSTRPKNMRSATAPMRSPSSWRGCSSSRRDINPHGEEYWAYIARMTEPLALYVHWPFCVSKCPYCRTEEHTSELQSIMRISYAVFLLKKQKEHENTT